LEQLAIPLLIIRGNNDFLPDWPQHRLLEFGTKRFLLIHIAPRIPRGCDVLLHGHTHVPRDEEIDGVRHLNPGTAGLPNKGAPKSFAWLDLNPQTGEFDWQQSGSDKVRKRQPIPNFGLSLSPILSIL